jgi:IS5 family transposase
MADDAPFLPGLSPLAGKPVQVTFDAGRLTSDGGILMLSGLSVDVMLTAASGTAERAAAIRMLGRQAGRHQATLGADKGYDTSDFVAAVRALNFTPHIARNTSRRSAIDRRTTRHPGYAASQRLRKRIEEGFGWIKTTGSFRKTRHRGTDRVGWLFTLTAAACNLIRLPKLPATA